MTENLKKLAVIMREYVDKPEQPPKPGHIRRLIDEAFGFMPEQNGPSCDSYSIAHMIEPDAIRTKPGPGQRLPPVPVVPPIAEN